MAGGFIGQCGINAPDAPTIGTPTGGNAAICVPFTAPSCTGGGAITGYVATAFDSSGNSIGASGSSSPVQITGLTNGTSYNVSINAKNAYGVSRSALYGSAVTPVASGQEEYTSAGTYCWVVPCGASSVSVVTVGGGGGSGATSSGGYQGGAGGGGGLAYKNNISVSFGQTYNVIVGGGGNVAIGCAGESYFKLSTNCTKLVAADGGSQGVNSNSSSEGGAGGSGTVGDVTRTGGAGGNYGTPYSGGGVGAGGGAAGYSGNGGNGGYINYSSVNVSGASGSGGGGGGGGAWLYASGLGGGGVGLRGEGSNGAGGANSTSCCAVGRGGGGSGGSQGGTYTSGTGSTRYAGNGGSYGGAGGGHSSGFNVGTNNGKGANGGVRIIWPGCARQYPSTRTANE